MLKNIINSKYFKWFRKSFLHNIHNTIHKGKTKYCCSVRSWHTLFICWKELKEVQENMNSDNLFEDIRENFSRQHCGLAWFEDRDYRLAFLNECLKRFK